MLTAGLAVLAAASNAVASVLQRYAARRIPNSESLRPSLILDLMRSPVWWGGIGGVIAGALFQAGALLTGRLAVVQPVLATELPLTLVFAALVFRRGFGWRATSGSLALTAGVALLLLSVSPSEGKATAPGFGWLVASLATVAFIAVLVVAGRATSGGRRAALFGGGAATGFAFTAALIKEATGALDHGVVGLLTTWQTYGACVAGLGTLFLLQNAYQAGSLAASQPVVTVGDALISLLYSAGLFDEQLRLGLWTIPAVLGLALILAGSIELTRSPLVSGEIHEESSPTP